MDKLNFTAIDFETATGYRNSACAVGIVIVKKGKITDEFYSLIQPPENSYWSQNIAIHGITSRDTKKVGFFPEIYKDIKKYLIGNVIVAHNESFDRSVLKKTMEYYKLDYSELNLAEKWECSCKIYKEKGFVPASLDACCRKMKIELKHHEALSDARGCAKLYIMHHENSDNIETEVVSKSKVKSKETKDKFLTPKVTSRISKAKETKLKTATTKTKEKVLKIKKV